LSRKALEFVTNLILDIFNGVFVMRKLEIVRVERVENRKERRSFLVVFIIIIID